MTWKLKRTLQCSKCPWLKDTNPREIPRYSESKHRDLADTISEPASLAGLGGPQTAMACHETRDAHCVGWLVHQVGDGNNIPLRLALMSCENVGEVRLAGDQHETFEETLPR